MTLTEFLTARVDEDEARYTSAAGPEDQREWMLNQSADYNDGYIVTEALRGLREVEAKRAIVAGYAIDGYSTPWHGCGDDCEWKAMEWAMRHLAAVYAEHPDYDEAWRP